MAIETVPVSSDTTMTSASLRSLSPTAARWRVPNFRDVPAMDAASGNTQAQPGHARADLCQPVHFRQETGLKVVLQDDLLGLLCLAPQIRRPGQDDVTGLARVKRPDCLLNGIGDLVQVLADADAGPVRQKGIPSTGHRTAPLTARKSIPPYRLSA